MGTTCVNDLRAGHFFCDHCFGLDEEINIFVMKKHAFTMTEIVMVVVILGMLAAMAIPKYMEEREQSRIDLTRQNLYILRLAINNFRLNRHTWPDNDLSDLIFEHFSGGDRTYIKEIPVEAITDKNTVTNFFDKTGGWYWDTANDVIRVNLADDPLDPRKKYSQW